MMKEQQKRKEAEQQVLFEDRELDTHSTVPLPVGLAGGDGTVYSAQDDEVMLRRAGPGTFQVVPELAKAVDLPNIDEYEIRDMFPPPPECKERHIYTAMKVSNFFSDLGTQLFYGCPHNIHLREALRDLKVAHDSANKAILSDLS